MIMIPSTMTERLTPLDLLMPRTYAGVAFTFRTTGVHATISRRLQTALDDLCRQLPWLTGRILPIGRDGEVSKRGKGPGLEIQWDEKAPGPTIVDKGVIEQPYSSLAKEGMPPAILQDVWPVPIAIDDALFAAGAPVLGVSLFRFNDGEGIGMCVCLHHNAVDAAGLAEVVRLWVRNIKGANEPLLNSGMGRFDRLYKSLASQSPSTPAQSATTLIGLHPEHSRTPPQLPAEFAQCTAKVFRVPIAQIDVIKAQLRECMPAAPTTNTLLCALVWSAITRARKRRSPEVFHKQSQLAMAVNGRGRINTAFSSADDPYYGNVVLYSLAKISFHDLIATSNLQSLATVCSTIAESQSSSTINNRHIAEVCSLVDAVDDYRCIFPGWDLFNSRDLTITSWADLDLYGFDFGTGLGKPEFIRMPYVEADGVGIVMPRKKGKEEILEVTVMLRRDDMAFLEQDSIWEGIIS
ncbi:hypothetical protein IQ07DRAFT_30092 [Pyrenochaeta sp. DS3sAY3a]|nr:hypothetical protein IQ07DRAFT_30092 [Pyrenochaeta sp. DS3sAY3a]